MEKTDGYSKKIYAITIAIGDYHKVGMSDLPTHHRDITFICNALTNGLKIDLENIRVLGNNGYVSSKELARTLKGFAELLSEDDSLIFYFSGHGQRDELVFSDGSINLKSILCYLDNLKCKNKLIILDCCYSGNFTLNGPKSMSFEDALSDYVGHGIAILASSAPNEVSRLGNDNKYSLFTEIVGTAMMSKRRIRKGYISLEDISNEVFYLMYLWNKGNPKKCQNPIFRSSIVGTIYFKVELPISYIQKQIYKDTERYTIYSVKPLHTAQLKRLCAFVVPKGNNFLECLPEITREIAELIRYENVYASKNSERRFRGRSADVIWCYYGKDERDIEQHRHYAYTIWASDSTMKNLYFKENKNAQVVNDIYVYHNPSYEMLRQFQVATTSRDDFILENKKLLAKVISLGETFLFDLQEIANKTITALEVQKKYRAWIGEVQTLFLQLSDLDYAPDDLYEWSNEILNLAGCIVDMSLLIEKDFDGRTMWLLQNSTRNYHETLVRLKEFDV